jgi:four helix bundle protein
MIYDLEERVENFGENIIDLAKKVRVNPITKPIIEQLVASGCSVGANYFEANGASSKKDFLNKIYIAKKEAKETQHWLRMIAKADNSIKDEAKKLWKEAFELTKILSTIIISSKKGNSK